MNIIRASYAVPSTISAMIVLIMAVYFTNTNGKRISINTACGKNIISKLDIDDKLPLKLNE